MVFSFAESFQDSLIIRAFIQDMKVHMDAKTRKGIVQHWLVMYTHSQNSSCSKSAMV